MTKAELVEIMAKDADFGIIYNDDAGGAFTRKAKPIAELVEAELDNLKDTVNVLAGTPVKTLCYCVGLGGDIMRYNTKVGSKWGWHDWADPAWTKRSEVANACLDAGVEPVRVVAEYAKEVGLLFLPSLRVNDLHFTGEDHKTKTLKFWMEHKDLVVGTVAPELPSQYEKSLDFTHEAVRKYKLDLIHEILDRFGYTIDGIELDFLRHPIYFPAGQGEAKGHLITEMVRKVRQRLDQMAKDNGRKYYLIVRVPTDLDSCRRVGLHVDSWLEERLIDVLIPGSHYFTTYEMPIESLVELAHKVGCKVHPCLFPKQIDSWPFPDVPEPKYCPDPPGPFGKHGYRITPRRVRAAAANYRSMGVDGFALFNLHLDRGLDRTEYADQGYRTLCDLAEPVCLKRTSKVFAITKHSWLGDYQVSFRKQLPADLSAGQGQTFTLMVGEDFDDKATRRTPPDCRLRLGFRGLEPKLPVEIVLNGQCLLSGSPGAKYTTVKCDKELLAKTNQLAEAFVLLPLDDLSFLRQGNNEIQIKVSNPTTLTDVELSVNFARQ